MTIDDFQKFQNKAIKLCDDYSTTSLDSEIVEMIWFTPRQLKQFAEYCLLQQKSNNHSKEQ